MPLDQSVAELILKIVADSTEVRKALEEASGSQKKFAKDTEKTTDQIESDTTSAMMRVEKVAERTTTSLQSFNRSLIMIGRGMRMVGVMMSAPIIGALAAASKTSGQVRLAMSNLGDAFQGVSKTVAKAVLPVVEKLTEFVRKLNTWLESLPKWLRESVLQFMLVTGVALTFAGSLIMLIRYFGFLKAGLVSFVHFLKFSLLPALKSVAMSIGTFLVSPLGIVLAVLALFIVAWMNNWLGIRDFTKSVLETIGKWIDWVYDKFKVIARAYELHEMGISWKDAWILATAEVANARKKLDEEGLGMEQRMATLADAAGAMADKIKEKLKSILGGAGAKGGKAGETVAEMKAGFEQGLKDLVKQWSDWATIVQGITTRTVQGMADTFSTGLFDFLTGEFKSFEEYFANFGRTLLKMLTDIIAQMLVLWALKAMFAGTPFGAVMGWHTGGAVKHFGGFIKRAHDGLAPGEVPIIAQSGEGVLSRNGMATLGGVGNLNSLNAGEGIGRGPMIYLTQVIRAWGPEDVYRERKMLASAMIDELEKQGPFRSAIRRYGR